MNGQGSIACEQSDGYADELALGQLGEPLRSELLVHAAECPHCHSLLDGLGTVADRLLLAAPQVEPPAGFESRALARLATTAAGPARRSVGLWWVAAAAVAGVMAFVGAFVVLHHTGHHTGPCSDNWPPIVADGVGIPSWFAVDSAGSAIDNN